MRVKCTLCKNAIKADQEYEYSEDLSRFLHVVCRNYAQMALPWGGYPGVGYPYVV